MAARQNALAHASSSPVMRTRSLALLLAALVLPPAFLAVAPPPRPTLTNADAQRRAAMNGRGDPGRGKAIFNSEAAGCAACHKVAGQGGDVGPDLSLVGGKLDRTHLIE